MSRVVDDDPPIKTHAATDAYRDNWERIFGEKKTEETKPVAVRFAWTHDSPNCDNYCDCYERAVEHHRKRGPL